MSNTELVKVLKSAISALQHGRRSTAQKKVALVDAQLNRETTQTTQTTEIRFMDTTELVEFIDGMDGCGLITTDLDLVASGVQARCFPEPMNKLSLNHPSRNIHRIQQFFTRTTHVSQAPINTDLQS